MYGLIGLWVLGKRSYKSPHLRRVLGVTRLIAYGAVVSAGLGAFAARSAVADVSEGSLRVGRELDKLGDLLGNTNEITLNGEKIFFSQASTSDNVDTVLDRFQAHCDEDPGMAGVDWQDLAHTKLDPAHAPKTKLGVMRTEAQSDGVVLCFRRNEGAAGSKTFATALTEFSSTKDLASIARVEGAHRPDVDADRVDPRLVQDGQPLSAHRWQRYARQRFGSAPAAGPLAAHPHGHGRAHSLRGPHVRDQRQRRRGARFL